MQNLIFLITDGQIAALDMNQLFQIPADVLQRSEARTLLDEALEAARQQRTDARR